MPPSTDKQLFCCGPIPLIEIISVNQENILLTANLDVRVADFGEYLSEPRAGSSSFFTCSSRAAAAVLTDNTLI